MAQISSSQNFKGIFAFCSVVYMTITFLVSRSYDTRRVARTREPSRSRDEEMHMMIQTSQNVCDQGWIVRQSMYVLETAVSECPNSTVS